MTLVSWAFAPDWLTIEEASALSGHPPEVLEWLVQDGALDTGRDGLIEKASLREFQETLLEVLQMDGEWISLSGSPPKRRQS